MDIGIGSELTREALQAALAAILEGCEVAVVDQEDSATVSFSPAVLAFRSIALSEFPVGISVVARLHAGVSQQDWLRELARCLAEQLQTRTWFDGTPFGDTKTPYWSLIWDQGVPYLADDCDTDFVDGEGGPVRIIRALPLTRFLPRLDLIASVVRD